MRPVCPPRHIRHSSAIRIEKTAPTSTRWLMPRRAGVVHVCIWAARPATRRPQSRCHRCTARPRFDVTKLGPLLDEIHERLAGVVIECLPWAGFVERYDSPKTLFYLDPPYWGSETDYGRRRILARRFHPPRGAAVGDRGQIPIVGERRAADPRGVCAVRDRERGDALHRRRRQMVRRRGDHRHRTVAA
jgi:hypothetical protein